MLSMDIGLRRGGMGVCSLMGMGLGLDWIGIGLGLGLD